MSMFAVGSAEMYLNEFSENNKSTESLGISIHYLRYLFISGMYIFEGAQ